MVLYLFVKLGFFAVRTADKLAVFCLERCGASAQGQAAALVQGGYARFLWFPLLQLYNTTGILPYTYPFVFYFVDIPKATGHRLFYGLLIVLTVNIHVSVYASDITIYGAGAG